MVSSPKKPLGTATISLHQLWLFQKDALVMTQCSRTHSIISYGLQLSGIIVALCFPSYAAEPIDGFRDLKFGMSPEKVKALPSCTTSEKCLYQLSNKNRYVDLTYTLESTSPSSDANNPPQLAKISIDMGRYSDGWHQQLQMILGNSYRLTHDFTDETMNAFLALKLEELKEGYEDGQVVLAVVRRPFGNLILKVIYQNRTFANDFIRKAHTPLSTTP